MKKYSIKDVENLTGIKAHTIRIWEKRYNIVEPIRSDTNIRFYSDKELKRIINISILNISGYRISKIAGLSDEELCRYVSEISFNRNDLCIFSERLLVALVEMNDRIFESTLSEAIGKLGFERCMTEVVYPFLNKIGVMWLTGTINPSQEHFISNLIRQKIITAIDLLPYPQIPHDTFLLFLHKDEMHEIGLLFYHYILKSKGYEVTYLGQCVPFEDLNFVVKQRNCNNLFSFFITAQPAEEINEYLADLQRNFPGKKVFVAGDQLKQKGIIFPPNIHYVTGLQDFLLEVG